MQRIYKVLQVVAVMNQGGAENMIMNYYRAIDKTKVQFDFLVHYPQPGFFDSEIEKLGGHIFRAMPIRPWSYLSYFEWLDNFFRCHSDYVAIHSHIQENSGFVFKYAAKYGIKTRIVNSHIADLGIDYKYMFRQFGRFFMNKYATDRFACGKQAGVFLYGKKDFQIFKNAINVNSFIYNSDRRKKIRGILGIQDNTFVVGHIGRFNTQKNHAFLIEIFKEVLRMRNDAILIMVGEGVLRKTIQRQVDDYGLSENVLFLGTRSDVDDIMQAFDILLFPSLYEGLPVSIIEAQSSGLQCVLSDTIDRETDITGNCHFISLSDSAVEWANETLALANEPRENTKEKIQRAGYDVTRNVEWLTNFYLR